MNTLYSGSFAAGTLGVFLYDGFPREGTDFVQILIHGRALWVRKRYMTRLHE